MQSFISIITGRLFWKIFLWFWTTTIIMVFGGALGAAYLLKDDFRSLPQRFEHRIERQLDRIANSLQYGREEAVKFLLKKGKPGKPPRDFFAPNQPPRDLNNPKEDRPPPPVHRKPPPFFIDLNRPRPPEILVIKQHGKELLGRDISFIPNTALESLFKGESNSPTASDEKFQSILKHRLVNTEKGENYLVIIKRPDKFSIVSRLFSRFISGAPLPQLHLLISFGFSLIVCFWLSWYLTRPIHILRQASRELAKGNLDYKVTEKIGSRRDEIADLSIDFEHMAERLQTLLNSQKQLLNDTSHELRSPLARLQVAVSLAMQKAGNISELELLRISTEVNRLDDLIGQILTVSRLEAQANYSLDDYIDIADLLRSIINDAQFEAKTENKNVHLQYSFQGVLKSNAALLHRAFDNIIRNALHYTRENTQVEVNLKYLSYVQKIQIIVCDQGDGVAEEQLPQLFEPFFRVDDSRERSQGGYGLGLAIAKRAIRLHGGTIQAFNQEKHGLCIEVQLPINQS